MFLQGGDFGSDGDGEFQNSFLTGGRGFLGQMADGGVLLQSDGAGIGRFGLENQREQRGFARAVRPHQADAVFAADLDGDIFKQCLRPVRFGKV